MKTSAAGLTFLAWLQFGCGPDPIAQAELGEVCGTQGPFRVLALEPDEQIMFDRPLRALDRTFFLTSRRGVDAPNALFPAIEGSTVWTTGPCGESPVKVATGIDSIFTIERWPDVVLGCEEATGSVVLLDPSGAQAPRVVFPEIPHTFGCGLLWTDYGVLSVEPHDEELGALLLHPYPDEPGGETPPPTVLLEPIRIRTDGVSGTGRIGRVLRSFPEFVLAVMADDTLVRVELADGAVSTVQPGVFAFEVSREGRQLLWQDSVVTQDDPRYPEGKIMLRDLELGGDALLAETALAYSLFPMTWADLGLLELGLGYIDREPKRVFFLPKLDFVELRADRMLDGPLDGDRWLASWLGSGIHDILDLRSGEERRLFPRVAEINYIDRAGGFVHMLEVPGCCVDGGFRDQGPLWRVPLDGSTPEKLATRAWRSMRRVPDGRIVSPIDLDEQWLGPLLLIDPGTGKESVIDQQVFAFSIDTSQVEEAGTIFYSVSDGDRSGVYLARISPPGRKLGATGAAGDELPIVIDMVPGPGGRPVGRPRGDLEALRRAVSTPDAVEGRGL